MKRKVCHLLPMVLVLAGLGSKLAGAQVQPSVSGKWVGVLDIVHTDGSIEPGDNYISLEQNGSTVTGTAGESPGRQSPISAGTVTGHTITFQVVVNPQMTVDFNLIVQGDRLSGSAAGLPIEPGSSIVVNAVRADNAWHTSAAVPHARDRLFDTVAALDRKLFDAYNQCDLDVFKELIADDLEFYHDKTGLEVGKQSFIESIHNNICGKVHRTLVPGTLEVHRLASYGAVEIGVHRFTHPGHESDGVGEAKFVSLWRFKDGQWMLTRAISYDHGAAK